MDIKKIFIYVHACELRLLEATRLYHFFLKNRDYYEIIHNPKEADIIIFFACTFSDTLAEKLLLKAKDFQKYNAELILAGCLHETKKEELANFFKGKTLSPKDMEKIDDLFPSNNIKFKDIKDPNVPIEKIYGSRALYNRNSIIEKIKQGFGKSKMLDKTYKKFQCEVYNNILDTTRFRSRFYTFEPFFIIKISEGCNDKHPCSSYFGKKIKKAVGPLKSKPIDQCVSELKYGLKQGYKNFVITADDSGAYGLDIGSSFPELLDEMTKISGDYNFEIENLTQYWIVKYIDQLEDILKRKKISRLKILIESASTRILNLMNRYSDIEKMKHAFLRLKEADPKISLFTHILVGFPTETEEEFKQSISFIKEIGFDVGYFYTFPFHANTDFDDIEPKVTEEILTKRMNYAEKFLKKAKYNVKVWCCFEGILFKKMQP